MKSFARIIKRLLGKVNPSFKYTNAVGISYTVSWTEKEPFCDIEEEEAEYFLDFWLNEYGFFFEQSGATGDWIVVTSKFDSSITKEFGFDTTSAQGARKNTYDLVDFIIENARSKEEEKARKEKNQDLLALSVGKITQEEFKAKYGG